MAELPEQPTQFDRPLPLRLIFPLLFVGVYLSHLTLLRLPYYWDEAGYYIPAAYDFFRTGDVIPSTTLANAHPPLPSLYLALWWKSGFTPAVTRTAMCLVTAIALLAVYRLGVLLNGKQRVAAAATLLTAIYPVWFAQSTLAHADMFAAAATLWGLVFIFPGRRRPPALWAAAACFAVAVLAKETAIVTPLAIALWEVYLSLRASPPNRSAHLRSALLLLFPVVPLLAWYAYYRHRTGFLFGNPEFLRYNATATAFAIAHPAGPGASPAAVDRAYEHVCARVVHAGGHAAAALAGTGRKHAASHLARGPGNPLRRHGGQHPVLFRAWRRFADALSAAALSAGSAVVRFHFLSSCVLLVGFGYALRGRFPHWTFRQPTLQVRP